MVIRASGALVLGVVATACIGVASAGADTVEADVNPYAVISSRNVFHLTSPPPPPAPEEKPVDVPKLLLSGFYKVGSNTRVLMAMPPKNAKDTTKYFNLAPGERDSSVEVVKINSEKGEVEIINTGTRMTLSLANDSATAKGAPVQPGAVPAPFGDKLLSRQARSHFPGFTRPTVPVRDNSTQAPNADPGVIAGGGDPGGVPVDGAVLANGGGLAGLRNPTASAPNAAAESGSAGSPRNVIVAGGTSVAAAAPGRPDGAPGGAPGAVYFPPNPGSAAANIPGADVGQALANPENDVNAAPLRPSGP